MNLTVITAVILNNLGHFLIIKIFMGSGWPMFSEKCHDVVSERFTARSIVCEKSSGDGPSVAQISH